MSDEENSNESSRRRRCSSSSSSICNNSAIQMAIAYCVDTNNIIKLSDLINQLQYYWEIDSAIAEDHLFRQLKQDADEYYRRHESISSKVAFRHILSSSKEILKAEIRKYTEKPTSEENNTSDEEIEVDNSSVDQVIKSDKGQSGGAMYHRWWFFLSHKYSLQYYPCSILLLFLNLLCVIPCMLKISYK